MIRWIASYPKSGNTWIRLFLMAYEDPGAFDLNQRSANHTQDTNADVYEQVAKAELQCLSDAEARLLRGAVLVRLSRFAQANSGGPAYLKTHSANVTVNGLAWIPPDFTNRSVYILRDPRDVAISLADHLGLTLGGAIDVMGDQQRKLDRGFGGVHVPLMSWSMHVQSWRRDLPYDQFALRYEDLLADPGRWLQAVLNFFGLRFDRTRFNNALELTSFERLRAEEDEHGYDAKSDHQARFFRTGKVGGWRDALSAEQAARIEVDHGVVMRECGYGLESEPCP
jgi:hypothetical protein